MMIFSRFSCRFGLVRGLRVFVCLVGSDHVGFGEYRGCCFVFGRHGGVRNGVCCFYKKLLKSKGRNQEYSISIDWLACKRDTTIDDSID